MKNLKNNISDRFAVASIAADEALQKRAVLFNFLGSFELRKEGEKLSLKGTKAILAELDRLASDTAAFIEDEAPVFRRTYLLSQIHSLTGLIRYNDKDLSGEDLKSAVKGITGLDIVQPYDPEEIEQHGRDLLKKYNFASYEDYKRNCLEKCKIADDRMIRGYIDDLKNFCIENVLPMVKHGSELEPALRSLDISIMLPEDGYPPCYFAYEGDGKAIVCLSEEHRKRESAAFRTVVHELVPGHLMSSLFREHLVKKGVFGIEGQVDLLYSSETPIHEGVAEWVPNIVKTENHDLAMRIEIEYAYDRYFKRILYNTWYYRFIEERYDKKEAVAYLVKHGKYSAERAKVWNSFVEDWKLYYPSYPIGTDIVEKHIKEFGDDAIHHLYMPKTVQTLSLLAGHLQQSNQRRGYEKGRSETGVFVC